MPDLVGEGLCSSAMKCTQTMNSNTLDGIRFSGPMLRKMKQLD